MSKTVVEELVALFGFEVDERALRRANQGVRRTEQTMERATRASSRMGAGIQGALLAWLGVDQAMQQFSGLVDANAQMDDLTAAMTLATGSSEQAERAMGWIAEFAARSPDQIQEVTEAFQMLQQQGLDPMDGRMVALGDTAAALQAPVNELMNATAGAAIGNLERLERMLVRYGYSLTSVDGVVQGSFMGEEFEIGSGFAAIEQFLVGLGEGRFAGQMERRAETINGAMSMLRDAVFQFRTSIGDSEFNTALVRLIRSMEQLFRGSEGGATVIGRVLAGALNAAARALIFVDTHAALVMAAISWLGGAVAIGALAALASAILSVGTAGMIAGAQIFGIPLAIAGIGVLIALLFEDIYRYSRGQESLVGRLIERYGELAEPIEDFIMLVKDVIEYGPQAFGGIIKDVRILTSAFDNLLKRLGPIGRLLQLNPAVSGFTGDGLAGWWANAQTFLPDNISASLPDFGDDSSDGSNLLQQLSDMAGGSRWVTMGGTRFEERRVQPSIQAPATVNVTVQAREGEDPTALGGRIGEGAAGGFSANLANVFRLLPGQG